MTDEVSQSDAAPIVSKFKGRSLVSIRELTKEEVLHLMTVAQKCKTIVQNSGRSDILKSHLLGLLFYEPSTRTRCSFETAMKRLGGEVVSVIDPGTSSSTKGESLDDTARMLLTYTDALVLRHPAKNSCKQVSDIHCGGKPIINAGDGDGEHPTQALLDLFTIFEFFKDFKSGRCLNITFAGDLRYGRTVHSLALLLAMFNVRIRYVAPVALELPKVLEDEVSQILKQHGWTGDDVRQTRHASLTADVLKETDVLYMTRIQQERLPANVNVQNFTLMSDEVDAVAPQHMKVLHPLPRLNEIPKQFDSNPHAAYFEQAENAVYARMALLALMFGKTHLL